MVAIEKKTERPNLWGLWQRIKTGIRFEFRLQKGAPSAEQKNVKDRLKTSGFVLKVPFPNMSLVHVKTALV